jgi:hypothetical protein
MKGKSDKGKGWEWAGGVLYLEDETGKKMKLEFDEMGHIVSHMTHMNGFVSKSIWSVISCGMTSVGFLITREHAEVINKYLDKWLERGA